MNVIDILDIVASLLFSGLLVGLYYCQHKTLKINQKPLLETSGIYLKSTNHSQPEKISEDADKLTVEISNYGDGAAKELQFVAVTEMPEGAEISGAEVSRPAYKLEKTQTGTDQEQEDDQKDTAQEEDPSWKMTNESSVLPHEQNALFRNFVGFGITTEEGTYRYANFQTGMTQIFEEHDVGKFGFKLFLSYKTQGNEEDSIPIIKPTRVVEKEDFYEDSRERPPLDMNLNQAYGASLRIFEGDLQINDHETESQSAYRGRITGAIDRYLC